MGMSGKKRDFPGDSAVKNSLANAGDVGSIPGLGRFPRVGHGNSLQYSSLGNPIDRGAWQATVHGVTKSQTQLSTHVRKKINPEGSSNDGGLV